MGTTALWDERPAAAAAAGSGGGGGGVAGGGKKLGGVGALGPLRAPHPLPHTPSTSYTLYLIHILPHTPSTSYTLYL